MFNVSKERRDAFERNVALATRHHMTTRGEHVVPFRPERNGAGWVGTPLEHWEGPNKIRQQFEQHLHQQPVPGVGRSILPGAVLPDGSVFGPTVQPPAPVQQTDPQPSATPRPVAQTRKRRPQIVPPVPSPPQAEKPKRPSPKAIQENLRRARAAIAKGASKTAVIARLRSVGIDVTDL
jgi:hypothetical protein